MLLPLNFFSTLFDKCVEKLGVKHHAGNAFSTLLVIDFVQSTRQNHMRTFNVSIPTLPFHKWGLVQRRRIMRLIPKEISRTRPTLDPQVLISVVFLNRVIATVKP